jgi:hypothetical protein
MSRNDAKRNAAFEGFLPVSGSGLDLDPGGQKLPRKIEKVNTFHLFKCRMFSFVLF